MPTKKERQLEIARHTLELIEAEMASTTYVTQEQMRRYTKAKKDLKQKQKAVEQALAEQIKRLSNFDLTKVDKP